MEKVFLTWIHGFVTISEGKSDLHDTYMKIRSIILWMNPFHSLMESFFFAKSIRWKWSSYKKNWTSKFWNPLKCLRNHRQIHCFWLIWLIQKLLFHVWNFRGSKIIKSIKWTRIFNDWHIHSANARSHVSRKHFLPQFIWAHTLCVCVCIISFFL